MTNTANTWHADTEALKSLSSEQRTAVAEQALGRILRLGSRPAQPGDVAQYERCKRIIMAVAELAA